MTEFTSKIFETLKPTLASGTFCKMRDLERALGVKERGLQAEDGKPGPMDEASEEIFRSSGTCIITKAGRGGGAKLSADIEEIKQARNQLSAHLWHEKSKVDRYNRFIEQLLTPEQMRLI